MRERESMKKELKNKCQEGRKDGWKGKKRDNKKERNVDKVLERK